MLLEPGLPVHAKQTYSIRMPPSTHTRKATCAEVDCPDYLHGWRLRLDGLQPADVHAVRHCGRRYVETHLAEGETWLVFEAGQPCFRSQSHTVQVRPELYVIRGGDHRGNPRGDRRVMSSAQAWVDDFGEHQEKLADKQKEG
jgi:hypothetical protein